MKKGAAIAVGVGAGLAALWAANKAGAFGSGSGEGTLGGTDSLPDSLTAEGNPFGRIDPNAPYYTPVGIVDPNTGTITPPGATGATDGYNGSGGPGSADTTGGNDPGAGGTGGTGVPGAASEPWYNTWYGQLGILAGATVAAEGAFMAGRAGYNAWRGSKLTGLGELKTEAGLERAGVKAADLAGDANKVGKAQDIAEMERLAARGTKVGDATVDAAKLSKGSNVLRDVRAVEPTGNAALDAARMSRVSEVGSDAVKAARVGTTAEAATSVGRIGKIAGTAGKVAGAAGGIIDTALVGYNIYSYEKDYKGQQLGVKDHAGIAVAGVAKTGEQTVDPLFSLVYRPKHVAEDLDYKESGWFAGFRENFWSGLVGNKNAAAQSSGSSGGSSRASVTQPLSVAPSAPAPVAQAIKKSSGGGGGVTIVAPKITSSTVLSTGQTVAQTTQSIQQLQAKGYNNAQIVNILSSQSSGSKSSGGSSGGSSSGSSGSKSGNTVSAPHAPTYKLPSWAAPAPKPAAPKPSGGKSKWP